MSTNAPHLAPRQGVEPVQPVPVAEAVPFLSVDPGNNKQHGRGGCAVDLLPRSKIQWRRRWMAFRMAMPFAQVLDESAARAPPLEGERLMRLTAAVKAITTTAIVPGRSCCFHDMQVGTPSVSQQNSTGFRLGLGILPIAVEQLEHLRFN